MQESVVIATSVRTPIIITTQVELDKLPVGSVVLTLWDIGPLHYVMQKYSDGWYGFPSENSLFPLGSKPNGGYEVALLWHPDWETVDDE